MMRISLAFPTVTWLPPATDEKIDAHSTGHRHTSIFLVLLYDVSCMQYAGPCMQYAVSCTSSSQAASRANAHDVRSQNIEMAHKARIRTRRHGGLE
eukprot:scaffold39203_cov144-Skeletonema_dohrnii-CCMP3373.AAC.1